MNNLDIQTISALNLEQELMKQPQVEIPVFHDFCNGLYSRTIIIPAGTLLTGAIHKDESFFLIRSGTLAVTTDDGPVVVGPGFMSVTRPGTKRVGLAFTEVVCTTFHANPTNEKNPDELWAQYTLPQPENAMELIEQLKALGAGVKGEEWHS